MSVVLFSGPKGKNENTNAVAPKKNEAKSADAHETKFQKEIEDAKLKQENLKKKMNKVEKETAPKGIDEGMFDDKPLPKTPKKPKPAPKPIAKPEPVKQQEKPKEPEP
jgi:hypothetical protein